MSPPSDRRTKPTGAPGVSTLSARLKAVAKSAGPAVVRTAAIAPAKASGSGLAESTTRGWGEATTTLATPPPGSCRRRSRALSLAASSRSGAPSVAAMEPDASMMNTVCSASRAAVGRTGWATAPASRATARSWRASSVLGRSFCQGAATDTGRATACHRKVELTSTGGRRGRRMCRSTMGTASSPSHSPAGLANLTAGPPNW